MPEHLRSKFITPPTGWSYPEPDGTYIRAAHWGQLIEMIKQHRKVNNIPVSPELEQEVESWICSQISPELCTGGSSAQQGKPRPVTVWTVTAATKIALYAWRNENRMSVSLLEAGRRAAICAVCSQNSTNAACLSCRGLVSWVRGWMPRTTPSDSNLYVCNATGIMNIAAVHMGQGPIRSSTPKEVIGRFAKDCWKLPLLEKVDAKTNPAK